MSAGGLSYSGLRSSSKITLPSVEMWGTNLNLLKDPPKSVMTRRVDRVGQTQSILEAQDQSGSRIEQNIRQYGLGINQMVEVNYGNMGGRNGGIVNPLQNTPSASLMYKIQTHRPPVQRQEDLLPLSRLPRDWFYQYTAKSFPDVVNASQCNETTKSINDTIIVNNVATTKTSNIPTDNTPREAAYNSFHEQVPLMSSHTNLYNPNQTYISSDYDTGSEKKSINFGKRDVVAITNKTTPVSGSSPSDFSSLKSGTIGSPLNFSVDSHKASSSIQQDNSSNFLAKDPKQINLNKRIYEAFTQKGINVSGNLVDKVDTNKYINKNKYLCIAKTARTTKENFVHPHQDSNTSALPTKDYLYKNVKTLPTSVFHTQPLDTSAKNSVVENPLHYEVAGTQRRDGGEQPTDNSVASFTMKPHLYTDVSTHKTLNEPGNIYLPEAVLHRDLKQKTLGSATANKNFIGTTQNAYDDASYTIHNDKRTPIHSVSTNTQAPFSRSLMHETTTEQKRRIPLMETHTQIFDPDQIEATRDPYQIQSRDGQKKTQQMLQKGGFEAQGSAVPVFDQYENYNYYIPDEMRQNIRRKTLDMFEGRYDSPPIFT